MRENELVDAVAAWLGERLPTSWRVEVGARGREGARGDAALDSEPRSLHRGGRRSRTFRPRDAELVSAARARKPEEMPTLVIAPWISARACELLAADRFNFVDLTGNALVRLESPALFIESRGADRDPSPRAQDRVFAARKRGA